MDWRTVTINDCCEILDSQRVPLNAEQRAKIQGNIPYYGANGVQGYISEYLFDEALILMAEDGGNFEQFSTRPIAYKISGKSWVNNHAHILKAKQGYNQDFVFYSLVHKNILYFIQGGTRSKPHYWTF
ncbi:MAG: restriction endonuclease subunit S [Saprospiraceae bacterium]|nr:restriction endonuclease subunit S [Saprospiraceae bacterium]